MSVGILVDKILLKIEIGNIVCDAPAKAFILNVKNHNAYLGCNSCTEEGMFINSVVFPDVDSTLRTDASFGNKIDEEYHNEISPLELLSINITKTVCLDYMHNVCLGVDKKFIEVWVKRKKDERITDENREQVNNEMAIIKNYIPVEF